MFLTRAQKNQYENLKLVKVVSTQQWRTVKLLRALVDQGLAVKVDNITYRLKEETTETVNSEQN